MTTAMARLSERQAWNAPSQALRDDPAQGERMSREAAGLNLDVSKNRITDESVQLLLQLTKESSLAARIEAMFRGEKINITRTAAELKT